MPPSSEPFNPNSPYINIPHPNHPTRYLISSDPSLLDLNTIHHYLSKESYWAQNIPFEDVKRAIEGSFCYGVYEVSVGPSGTSNSLDTPSSESILGTRDQSVPPQQTYTQIGLARLITDYTTFAYLSDVFIVPSHQSLGLGRWLISNITNPTLIPWLGKIRRVMLATGDKGPLYERFAFHEGVQPGRPKGFSYIEQGKRGIVFMERVVSAREMYGAGEG